MDLILLTDKELVEVRSALKNLAIEKEHRVENIKLFESLFKTWSHNPISTITLCLLAQQYELSYRLIITFAEVEIDLETLT
jgi:vacuole morphology and inheritance protein 14